MATSLNAGFFKRLKASPSVLPDGHVIASIATASNPVPVFGYSGIESTGLLVRMRSLQVNGAGLDYRISADGYQTPWLSDQGFRYDSLRTAYGDSWNLAATSALSMQARNQSGATQTSVSQNWAVQVDYPSIAQKLQFPDRFSLSPQEQALAAKMGLLPPTPRGVLPRSLSWIIENVYKTQIVDAFVLSSHLNVGTTGPVTFGIVNRPSADTAVILVSFNGSSGSGSDGLTWMLSVDGEDDFLSLPAYSMYTWLGQAIPIFVQAERQIQVSASATTAVNNVYLRAGIWIVRLTDEIRYRQNLSLHHVIGESPTLDKLVAGVI